eukprot:8165995-Ditylum_brightwellii.AAC.1
MNRPDADGFKDAIDAELGTLTDIKAWIIVKQRPGMNVLGYAWVFKIEQFPNGTINMLKACLCVCGDQQIEVFVNATVEEEIYMEMPQGYKQEGNVLKLPRFLGVSIDRNAKDRMIALTQSGLIDRIINALGLKDVSATEVPSEVAPLGKDLLGKEGNAAFNHLSMIGMMFNSKASHEAALKIIGRYLKGTQGKGLVIGGTNNRFDIYCQVETNFSRLWTSESPYNPDCARSRTGFVITLCNCLIIWASMLQKEQSSSTMEAEYVALGTAMKDLLPFQCLVKEIVGKFNLQKGDRNIRSKVWEDNSGALILDNMESGCFTQQSKHFGIQYYLFCRKIKPNNIK